MPYRLTDWQQLKDQDAEVRHLVEVDGGSEWDGEDVIATYSRTEIGERLADAALALVNGNLGLTSSLPSWGGTLPSWKEPLPPQIVVVNGLAVAVLRDPNDHVLSVFERAVEMAGYKVDRGWEIKDEDGNRLGYKDDPDAVRFISLPAGVAS